MKFYIELKEFTDTRLAQFIKEDIELWEQRKKALISAIVMGADFDQQSVNDKLASLTDANDRISILMQEQVDREIAEIRQCTEEHQLIAIYERWTKEHVPADLEHLSAEDLMSEFEETDDEVFKRYIPWLQEFTIQNDKILYPEDYVFDADEVSASPIERSFANSSTPKRRMSALSDNP